MQKKTLLSVNSIVRNAWPIQLSSIHGKMARWVLKKMIKRSLLCVLYIELPDKRGDIQLWCRRHHVEHSEKKLLSQKHIFALFYSYNLSVFPF